MQSRLIQRHLSFFHYLKKQAKEAYNQIVKSAANIKGIETTNDKQLNVYDVLKYETCIMVKDAVATIEEVYAE